MTTSTTATFIGNGTTTDFAFSFDYLRKEFVQVTVEGVPASFTFLTSQTVKITPAPASGKIVIIRRVTDRDRLVEFVDGSVLGAGDLNVSQLQAIHIAAEALDAAGSSLLIDQSGAYAAGFRRLTQVAPPTQPSDAVTKDWAETAVASSVAAAAASAAAAAASATTASNNATNANTSKNATTAARDVTLAARDVTTAARDVTTAARDVAVAAKDLTVTNKDAVQVMYDELIVAGAVPTSRVVNSGTGLQGGGNLTANRTLSVKMATAAEVLAGVATDVLPNPAILRQARDLARPAFISLTSTALTEIAIPDWAMDIDLMFYRATLPSATPILVQLGTASGLITTGYFSSSTSVTGGSATTLDNSTGFVMNTNNLGEAVSGHMRLSRSVGLDWISSHAYRRTNNSNAFGGGVVTASEAVTRLSVRTGSGGLFTYGQVGARFS